MIVSRQFSLFVVVGLISTLIHFTVLFVLVEYIFISPVGANFIAFFASLAGSYSLNHKYTFNSSLQYKEAFPRYLSTVLVGLSLNQSIMWISVDLLAVSYIYGFAFVTVIVPLSNYFLHKHWTFYDKGEAV